MNAIQWGGMTAIFLASAVEWVEAFTIVLAVSLTIGWARTVGAAAAALAVVAMLVAVTGAGLNVVRADMDTIRAGIGIFLLLFGLRWYVKAVRRYAGRTKLHDEATEFAETRRKVDHAEARVAWAVAFKGVLLEGLEVWLLVVALGRSISYGQATASALAALLVVIFAGMALRAPLTRVPENTLKFTVACALLSFGTFWSLGGLLGEARVWPLGDATLLPLFAIYATAGRMSALKLRMPAAQAQGARA
ncbi:MAG: High-affinity Fe2+/Pb2+ permease [Betaproteobacteria bacterium]|nr:High-affinity Fe2+/Pb2+ permease [Betaproteobacteria bacterium]